MKNKKKIIIIPIIFIFIIGLAFVTKHLKKEYNDLSIEEQVAKTYTQVKAGDEKVDGTNYVTFDAFYLRDINRDGYAEKIRGTCKEIGTEDTLYIDLNVLTNGTLKNASIEINGKNFYLSTALVQDNVIAQDSISSNTKVISLKDISSGTQKMISGIVKSGDYSNSGSYYTAKAIGDNIDNYSVNTNSVTLTGTHVADNGTETQISKTVYLTNDWYGTTITELDKDCKTQEYNIVSAVDEEKNKLNIEFNLIVKESKDQLNLSKQHLEGTIPLLNGYAPSKVSIKEQNVDFNYNSSNRTFTVERTAKLDENKKISTSINRWNEYQFEIEYPLEAYKATSENAVALNIPIKTWYEGYNNPSSGFSNPYRSNIAQDVVAVIYDNPEGDVAIVHNTIGKSEWYDDIKENIYKVSKELPSNIYNQVENDENSKDRYDVSWELRTGKGAYKNKFMVKDSPESYTDKVLDNNGTYHDFERYVSNVGMYFSYPTPNYLLGEDGYINVYNDETNELLHKFTKDDWNNYTESNPFMYDTPVKHIRIETSEAEKSKYCYIRHIKEIDDVLLTAEISYEEFLSYTQIYNYVTGYITPSNGNEYQKLNSDIKFAEYELPGSVAKLSIYPDYIFNQETAKNVSINIKTITDKFNYSQWKDGVFLIKYPSEVIDVNVNNIYSNSETTVVGIDTYEHDGNIYTKIYTENEEAGTEELNLDVDITADPRNVTATNSIELYSYNLACNNYDARYKSEDIYDLNGNGNIKESIGYTKCSFNIMAPSSLLTSQTATNYDEKDSIAVSPQEAIIEKKDSVGQATVNVNLTNNYSGTISEIKVVGKIPFKGNTYQLNGEKLGSEFNTTMTNSGIKLSDNLKRYARIYYSYNEKVTEDLNSKKNGWTTSPQDWSKVKNYMIDLSNYSMPIGNTETFSYDIQVPAGLNYNEVSYSDHAVYFCLDTTEGKLKTQTEPNKLGFKIAKKFDVEITKYEINTDKRLSGVTFSAEEKDSENVKTATTFSDGVATLKGLFVEKEYTIKEIRADRKYVVDDKNTVIIGHIVNGELQIEVKSGGFKEAPVIEGTTVKASFDDEVKYNFELNKIESSTTSPIQGIRFELTGQNGKVTRYTTNSQGKLNIKLLEPNVRYTLTETESQGHYLKEPVSFMMVRDSNKELKFNVLSGDFDSLPQIDKSGEIPVVKAQLGNEKIPTYSLKITKTEKGKSKVLKGAQFKITGENKKGEVYTTDENGVINIDNLYEFVSGKNITGQYTLQEIYPSEGYILNETPIVFKLYRNSSNRAQVQIISGTTRSSSITDATSENPVLNLNIDNEPVFKLTKTDSETGEPLEGVEFKITDQNGNYVNDPSGNPIGASQGEELELETSGEYQWTQNEDGTWQSNNYNVNSSESVIQTQEFTIDTNKKLSFDWSVSSESASYDYLYYTITNVKTNATIGGVDTKIGGTGYGTNYNSLVFLNNEIDLTPGTYKVEFKYVKDSSQKSGLDRGYIKNVKLVSDRVVKTDKNGELSLNLATGLYRISEMNPLYGYQASNYTKDFGVGKSQPAEYEDGILWTKTYDVVGSSELWIRTCKLNDGVIIYSDTGRFQKYDFNGNLIWDKTNTNKRYNEMVANDSAIYAIAKENGESICYFYKYNLNGELIFTKTLSNYDKSIALVSDGVLVGVGSVIDGSSNGKIIKYDFNGNLKWSKNLDSDIYEPIKMLDIEDGIFLIGQRNVIDSEYWSWIAKYTYTGNLVWKKNIQHSYFGNDNHDNVLVVDDGIIITEYGLTQTWKFDFDGNIIWNKRFRSFGIDCDDEGFYVSRNNIQKYDFDGNLLYEIEKDNDSGSVRSIICLNDSVLFVGGNTATDKKMFISKLGSIQTAAAIPQLQSLSVTNTKKQYKITTEVDGTGGKISGQNQNPYESVKHGEDSVKDIIATPNSGYNVIKITINGEEVPYNVNENGTVELDKFVNMTSDKHIVVKFSNNSSNVIEHHYIKGTTTRVAEDKVQYGEVGNNYTTAPKMDLHRYRLVKLDDGKYQIPDNASGVFKDQPQVITYYYELKPLELLVHHYIDGTSTSVAPDENSEGEEGESYTTNPVSYPTLDEKYELVSTKLPSNANGIFENPLTEVTYYYKIKEHKITTEVDGIGGSISGEAENPYEKVLHGEDSIKDIIITPNTGYQISKITINGEVQNLPEDKKSSYSLDKFTNMIQDKHIVVSFEIQKKDITVYKVWKDSNNVALKRPNSINTELYNGSNLVATQVITEELNGNITLTIPDSKETVTDAWKYTFVNVPMYTESGKEINYRVVEKESNTNELYMYNEDIKNIDLNTFIITNTFEVPDEKIELEATKVWTDNSNENSKRPSQIKLQVKNVDIVVQEQIINAKNGDTQTYKFVNLSKYDDKGNEIAYTIDEKEVNEDDLKFYSKSVDNENYVITNTFEVPNEKIELNVTKKWMDNDNVNNKRPNKIKLQVKDEDNVVQEQVIDVDNNTTQTYKFINLSKYDNRGNEIAYTIDEKEINEDDLKFYSKSVDNENYVITNTFTVPDDKIELEATKKWLDNSDINKRRPAKIKLQVKNEDVVVQEQVINTNEGDIQTYKFINLAKYNSSGNEIIYKVDEIEVSKDDLKFYNKSIDNENHIIANTFTVPDDKIELEVTKKWLDNNNLNNVRPSNIKIIIKNGENIVREEILDVTQDEEKVYKIENLQKYDENGQEIVYTIDEENITGYNKTINGTIITNTIKSYKVTTEVNGIGGNITGKDENPYEIVNHGGNSVKDIVIQPEKGYFISKITINGEEQNLPEDKEKEYMLDKFTNMIEDKHIIVEFSKKEYKITTEVKGIGGDITGKDENPYEVVNHGENSIKDIIVIPESKYMISTITINGVEQELSGDKNNSYMLDKFINMTEDKHIIVTFEKKDTSVITKYVDIDSEEEIYNQNIIEGKIDDDYNTVNELVNINNKYGNKYKFVRATENTEGNMTEEQIEVIYYYQKKETKIKVLHVVEGTDITNPEEVTDVLYNTEEIKGKVDDDYTTQNRLIEINNNHKEQYDLVTDEVVNKTGKMTVNTIYVVYEYRTIPAVVKVNHLEKDTNTVLHNQEVLNGLVGNDYTTQSRLTEINNKFENKYELVGEPENKNGVYTREEQEVIYYYQKKEAQIEVNYLELNTDKVLSEKVEKTGRVDDNYTTENKLDEINNLNDNKYEFVKVEGNAQGQYTLEKQVITYYYQKKESQIEVNYLELNTDKVLSEKVEKTGRVDDNYTTENKLDEINNLNDNKYEFVKVEGNTEGQYTLEKQVITYYYQKKSTSVIVKYLDINTNEEIYKEDIINGKIDDDYTTKNKLDEINNLNDDKYEFVKSTDNTEGKMIENQIEVVYYYQKKETSVIVKYIDIDTNEELAEEEIIEGRIDDEYKSEDKAEEINETSENKYILVKTTENIEGKMTIDTIEVIYYYKKVESQVVVKFVDKDTGEEIEVRDYIGGYVGDEYTTKPKDIDGYELIEERIPINKDGILTEDTIEIIYYYNKIVNDTTTSDINIILLSSIMILSIIGIIKIRKYCN